MDLTTLTLGELAAFAVAVASIGAVIGAIVKWVSSGDDRVRSEGERDLRAMEKKIDHNSNNNKLAFAAVASKLDNHNTEITRLSTEQRSLEKVIVEMRAEIREQSHNQTKLIDTRFDAIQTMIKEDRETHKDALKALAEQVRSGDDTLATSIREIRTVVPRP